MDIDVWLGDPAQVDDAHERHLRTLLSDEERGRADRFIRPGDRRTFICAHALLRDALSFAGCRSPNEWRFVAETYGKPALAPEQRAGAPAFNLTHTAGLVAVALGVAPAIGIDAEAIERQFDASLARRVLVPRELGLLERAGPSRLERFFELWTGKEAVAKALGLGLNLAFESFGIGLDPPRIVEFPAIAGAAALSLTVVAPLPTHRLAVAAAAERPLLLRVRCSALVMPPHGIAEGALLAPIS